MAPNRPKNVGGEHGSFWRMTATARAFWNWAIEKRNAILPWHSVGDVNISHAHPDALILLLRFVRNVTVKK